MIECLETELGWRLYRCDCWIHLLMASSKSMKKAILNFASSPSKSKIKQITVEWNGKKIKISRLCVTICTLKTGELVFLFTDLKQGDTVAELPLQLDTKAGAVKLAIYGLTERGSLNQCYVITSSGVRKLTQPIAEEENGKCTIALSGKHTQSVTCTELKEKVEEFQIGIKQQPPSWYYVSSLPTAGTMTNPTQNQFLIILQQKVPFEETMVLKMISASNALIPAELPSLTDFSAKVYWLKSVLTTDSFKLYTVNMSSDIPHFRTYLSLTELETLYERAMLLVPKKRKQNSFHFISHFYRNKPPEYYENIFRNCGGVMEKYCKDYNGDRGSSINGNIDGLFFGTSLDHKTLRPPDFSYYGRQRLHIPAHIVFHDNTNLYFADFYCHYEVHYVTLVLTERGSPTDLFCKSRLLQVDPYDNPFLFKWQSMLPMSKKICVTMKLHVEVFYTEDVHIQSLLNAYPMDVFFTTVRTMGAGKSKPSGIPKNANCKICNLK